MIAPFLNTFAVCAGSSALATLLGLTLALLTTCFRVPLNRLMATIVLSLLLVPIYVQATAWSAGFGVQGWFRLSQVSAALSPITAIASVVWIHGTAGTPVCFLLCTLGLRRATDSSTRQALVEFGPCYAVFYVLLPNLWPWVAAGAIWTIAMTGNDMVVTNLFQVATITETVYQQVQFEELNRTSIALACSYAVFVGLLVFGMFWLLQSRIGGETAEPSGQTSFHPFELRGFSRWIGFLLGWIIVSIVVLIPLTNLIVKAGWVATMEEGVILRTWSPYVLLQSILHTKSFMSEIGWSIQLSLYSTCLALGVGCGMATCTRSRRSAQLLIGLMGFLLALPGPIVNLMLISLFDRNEPEWISFLADRTLVGPILALQSRCLPIVFGILWLANERYSKRNHQLLRLDKGLHFRTRSWILIKATARPVAIAVTFAFFVAFADLSSYLLVQPPQVTTVAMRMFDLLHYGIKNQEAGLALSLIIAGAVPTMWFVRRIT